jgi:SAM-dependent methyltransferase
MKALTAYARGLTSAVFHRAELVLLRLRVRLQLLMRIAGDYQPNPFTERETQPDRRMCRERFAAFSETLPKDAKSCIDIGCNIGYFTLRFADRGGVCLGVDVGRNEISVARGLARLNDVRNAAFLQWEVTPQNVAGLPFVDVIICMSVFHHWARKLGLEGATQIVDGLAARCRFLVFETGQNDEVETSWASHLSFMGADSDAWIRSFLKGRGFTSVKHLGLFSTTLSSVPRHLYLAERSVAPGG